MTAMVATPAHVPEALVVDADIYDLPGGATDPQGAWKALDRPGGPGLIWTPRNGGHWIATSADLIWSCLADTERLSNRHISVPVGATLYPMIPNQSDAPEHHHYRRAILPFLRPLAVKQLTASVRELAISLIEGFRQNGHCEFMSEFARHLPMRIFLSLVDLPEDDRAWLVELAEIQVRSGSVEKKQEAQKAMIAYLQRWIDQRRERPGGDMLSAIIHAQVGDRPMTPEEIMGESMDVMFGGLDTVASMMGFIMRFLATHPDHYRQLVDQPGRIPLAIEELLRRHGVASIGRLVKADMELNGVALCAGDMVMLPTCLHGLDDRAWEDAERVDFDRHRRKPHATFGNGVHICPGAALARSEIAIMLEEWTRRIPRFALAPGEPPLAASGAVNGMIRLDLAWPV